jgi:hypothetical protein
MRLFRYLTCLLLILVTLPALAFERHFPTNVKRAKLTITNYPNIKINGKDRMLSPAARIWTVNNLTVVPNALGDATFVVNYTEDIEGAIDRVWVLTPEEAAVKLPS